MTRQAIVARQRRALGLCSVCGTESICSRCGDCSRREAEQAKIRKTNKRNRNWSSYEI